MRGIHGEVILHHGYDILSKSKVFVPSDGRVFCPLVYYQLKVDAYPKVQAMQEYVRDGSKFVWRRREIVLPTHYIFVPSDPKEDFLLYGDPTSCDCARCKKNSMPKGVSESFNMPPTKKSKKKKPEDDIDRLIAEFRKEDLKSPTYSKLVHAIMRTSEYMNFMLLDKGTKILRLADNPSSRTQCNHLLGLHGSKDQLRSVICSNYGYTKCQHLYCPRGRVMCVAHVVTFQDQIAHITGPQEELVDHSVVLCWHCVIMLYDMYSCKPKFKATNLVADFSKCAAIVRKEHSKCLPQKEIVDNGLPTVRILRRKMRFPHESYVHAFKKLPTPQGVTFDEI